MNKIGIVIQQTDTYGEMKGRRREGEKQRVELEGERGEMERRVTLWLVIRWTPSWGALAHVQRWSLTASSCSLAFLLQGFYIAS